MNPTRPARKRKAASAASAPNATNNRHCARVAVAPPPRLGHPIPPRRVETARSMNEPTIRPRIEKLSAGGFLATSADVPGLVAEGRSVAETMETAQGACPQHRRVLHRAWRPRFLRPSPIRSSPKPASACACLSASRRWAVSPDSGTGSASPEAVGSDWEVTKSQDHRARHCRSVDTLPACDARAT